MHETYLKKDNPDYSDQTSGFVGFEFLVPLLLVGEYADPTEAKFDDLGSDDYEYDNSVKYHSWGGKNLSIEASAKVKGEVDKEAEKEYTTSGKVTVTYDNLFLTELSVSSVSNYGNKMNMEGKVVLDKEPSINLPSDWKKCIVNQ